MDDSLKIIIWNANGLLNHALEFQQFLRQNNIDIALISETHFNSKAYIKIPGYKIHATNHPDGSAHGGSAIIIKNKIKYTESMGYQHDHIQSTNIQLEDNRGAFVVSSIYSPPKHKITPILYETFLKTLGPRFITGGDFNAKHTNWGSRTTNKKGKNLLCAIKNINGNHMSTGEPTYWPTDIQKKPDLIDFYIIKGMDTKNFKIKSCFELSSDHSPVQLDYIADLNTAQLNKKMYNKKTDWDSYREYIRENIKTKTNLKLAENLEAAIIHLNDTICAAAYKTTPKLDTKMNEFYTHPSILRQIKHKRKLRKVWQTTRTAEDKKNLNKATKELKETLRNEFNHQTSNFLRTLTSTPETNYSLWKAAKNLTNTIPHQPPLRKNDGSWTKSDSEKVNILSDYFENVFANDVTNSTILSQNVTMPLPDQKIKNITSAEITKCIKFNIDIKKSPGYDMIDGKLLIELPKEAIDYVRNIYNAIIRLKYYPKVWKVAQIIAIPKQGKDLSNQSSYRPISLLPVLSKLFERLLHKRIAIFIDKKNAIPDYQFGFRRKYSTIQQVHRVTHKILNDFNDKKYCVGVFLDVEKAFDKVWHDGLIHKLRHIFPQNLVEILTSYISERKFYVKHNECHSSLRSIKAGIPQGSVLGPTLYMLYTADIPIPLDESAMIATFADDTILLHSDKSLTTAVNKLQNVLNATTKWFDKWNIKINKSKTTQVIYTTKTQYNPVHLKIDNAEIPIDKAAKYLGIHIDNKLTWKQHILKKRNQIKLRLAQLNWFLRKDSTLSTYNKLLLYKSIIKPIWTYGIQLWGTAKKTNINIIQRQQSKILRTIIGADWYISNADIHKDLNIPTVEEEITTMSRKYQTNIAIHSNNEINSLPTRELTSRRRLQRRRPVDLI